MSPQRSKDAATVEVTGCCGRWPRLAAPVRLWTLRHEAWIRAKRFDERAPQRDLAHYQATLDAREAAVDAIEADLAQWYVPGAARRAPFTPGRLPGASPSWEG